MRFVDLFAGLGGFHVALSRLGHECVLASEIEPNLQSLYEKNFALKPNGDVRKIKTTDIPRHDILCAGFPCQPFSKAGHQQGLDCPQWGDLFGQVTRFLNAAKPTYFILENVPNLERHDNGLTWVSMQKSLRRCGYNIDARKLSPHQFGVPQIRERLVIVGSRKSLRNCQWPAATNETLSIKSVLDSKPKEARRLTQQTIDCLNVWQNFLDLSPRTRELPSFPIWSMEFGATYPYSESTPYGIGTRALAKYRGVYGQSLRAISPDKRFDQLPSYARAKRKTFPGWKKEFIRQNREFFAGNKKWILPWLKQIAHFPPSLQKFEWRRTTN